MATLSQLFPVSQYLAGASASGAFSQVRIYNTNVDSPQNGGACCLWSVPSGTTWIRFELWGGGSDGPGGCCCQQPNASGGAGAYARKTVTAVAGNSYTICAGGTGCCSVSCCGTQGFTTYVCGGTSTGAVNMCAAGGPPSCSLCWVGYNGCGCIGNTETCRSGSYSGADFGLPAIGGSSNPSSCGFQSWQYVPSGPYIGTGVRHSHDYCQSMSGCLAIGGFASFPGGGGGGAHSNGGGCCWGGFGAGGLVVISYR
jgi:hypothetical protein